MKIVLFGDSFLGRFGKNLIDQLETAVPGAVVYNCAAGGWNSADLSERAGYIAQLKPDYVILSFGGNDVAPWKDTVPLAEFKRHTESILQAFNSSRIIMLQCPSVDLADPEQTNQYNGGLDHYYGEIDTVLEQYRVMRIDTNALLSTIDNYHEEDGVHMNQAAYDKIIPRIAQLIRDRSKGEV